MRPDLTLGDDTVYCEGEPGSWAVFSPDRAYRYALGRSIELDMLQQESPGYVLWVMLNPSAASESNPDNTMKRCVGFTRSWCYTKMVIVNLYAVVSTDASLLRRHESPIGLHNNHFIAEYAKDAALIVCAWGDKNPSFQRAREVTNLLAASAPTVNCLGVSLMGNPRHPLMLPGDLVPVPFQNTGA